ncbi:glycosyltransferase family 2 protein [Clostridium gasigenes]|uniref:glycosyltransferase family 2 protein n=1 Tax=Clostridium gasigenes TaxID=94869 RepID=UPI001C0E3E6B|nr:glycosyltransferase family 2 protein [Clostridium gasigenes]MBU3133162.1 glycosyltransferase family 2 protein [Clostridium gasigenes]
MTKNKQKKVSIILLNYNTTDDIIDCLSDLCQIHYTNYQVIIVDNNSREEEVKRLSDHISDIERCILIESKINGGFAKGNNIGIEYAIKNNTDYLLLLNGDTKVEKNFLVELVNQIDNDEENVAIAIGKILYYSDKNKIWYAGGEIDWSKYIGRHYGEGQIDSGQYDETKEISFATGCLMLINTKLNIDLFLPEDYFMYYEDVDYCASVLESGYKIIYAPKSVIYHKVGSSSGGEQSEFTVKWANRGRYIFMNKYKYKISRISFEKIRIKFFITRLIKIIFMILKGDINKAKALYEGIKDSIKVIRN